MVKAASLLHTVLSLTWSIHRGQVESMLSRVVMVGKRKGEKFGQYMNKTLGASCGGGGGEERWRDAVPLVLHRPSLVYFQSWVLRVWPEGGATQPPIGAPGCPNAIGAPEPFRFIPDICWLIWNRQRVKREVWKRTGNSYRGYFKHVDCLLWSKRKCFHNAAF